MIKFFKNQPTVLGFLTTLLALVTFISGFWAPHQWFLTAICVVILLTERKQKQKEKNYGKV